MATGSLLNRQVRLFEAAHREPTELKSVGYALRKQGVLTDKLYCNPRFILLPWTSCDVLSFLTPQQTSILTATYFANFYAHTASSETFAIEWNTPISGRLFPHFSDEYMVLFHEADEEYDHIICFRALVAGLTGRDDLVGSYYKLGKHVLSLYEKRLCVQGFASIYLLHRFILNIALKQTEAFMHVDADPERFDPLATQVARGHASDEARHLTTSLELGMRLFEQATPKSRGVVREIIAALIDSLIRGRFSPNPLREKKNIDLELAAQGLRLAFAHPEFGGAPVEAEVLEQRWRDQQLRLEETPELERSKRWLASQIQLLMTRTESPMVGRSAAHDRYESLCGAT